MRLSKTIIQYRKRSRPNIRDKLDELEAKKEAATIKRRSARTPKSTNEPKKGNEYWDKDSPNFKDGWPVEIKGLENNRLATYRNPDGSWKVTEYNTIKLLRKVPPAMKLLPMPRKTSIMIAKSLGGVPGYKEMVEGTRKEMLELPAPTVEEAKEAATTPVVMGSQGYQLPENMVKYIRGIKNTKKSEYANKYAHWLLEPDKVSEPDANNLIAGKLSAMAAQAVRMELDGLKEQAKNQAEVKELVNKYVEESQKPPTPNTPENEEAALKLAEKVYRPYIERGDTLDSIVKSYMGYGSREEGDVQTGGYLNGKKLRPGEVAVTLPDGSVHKFKLKAIAERIKGILPKPTQEPWEMTLADFRKNTSTGGIRRRKWVRILGKGQKRKSFSLRQSTARKLLEPTLAAEDLRTQTHLDLVKKAIEEGKPVPPEVLKQYPGLTQTPTPPASRAPVSELAAAGQILGHLPSNDLMESNGHWFYVGSVDSRLAYVTKDGEEPTDEQIKLAQSIGPELAGLKTKTWDSKEAALEALKKISPEEAKTRT